MTAAEFGAWVLVVGVLVPLAAAFLACAGLLCVMVVESIRGKP